MTITSVTLMPARVPRIRPFRTSRAVQHSVDGVFVEIEDSEGFVGTGEAPPRKHINGETLESATLQMDEIARSLIGLNPIEGVQCLIEYSHFGSAARIGLEMALLDIASQNTGLPLCDYVGDSNRDVVHYGALIGSRSDGDRLDNDIKKIQDKGYQLVRVKVGELGMNSDLKRLETIRKISGDGMQLWVDANQGWYLSEVLNYVNELESYGIMMIEQPFDENDYTSHEQLQRATHIPIMIDEGVQDEEDLDRVIDMKCASAVNLKALKLGSVNETKRLLRKARLAGLQTYCGGTALTDVFATFARHVEFGMADLMWYTTGIPRSNTFKENPSTPRLRYEGDGAYARRPTLPGMGIKLDHQVFDKYVEGEAIVIN